MNLTLYSFKICPFVEQVNILLNEKQITPKIIYINIRDKPDWYWTISPLGKVPVLKVDDTIIFETAVINEYLNDTCLTPAMHPDDPLQKAHNKAWIEWGTSLMIEAYNMTLAGTATEFIEKKKTVNTKLAQLNNELKNAPFFNGDKFSMIDIAYAPLFRRFDSLYRIYAVDILSQYPRLKEWAGHILARPNVQNGFVHNFDEEFAELLQLKGSYFIFQTQYTN